VGPLRGAAAAQRAGLYVASARAAGGARTRARAGPRGGGRGLLRRDGGRRGAAPAGVPVLRRVRCGECVRVPLPRLALLPVVCGRELPVRAAEAQGHGVRRGEQPAAGVCGLPVRERALPVGTRRARCDVQWGLVPLCVSAVSAETRAERHLRASPRAAPRTVAASAAAAHSPGSPLGQPAKLRSPNLHSI